MPGETSSLAWWQRPFGRTGWQPVWPTEGNWRHLFPSLQAKPSDFYSAVKEAVRRREVPDASFSEVIYREAGYFSAGRAYLRVSREDHVFDICAAPYGSSFFISWWFARARPSPIWPTLGAAFYSGLTYLFFVEHFGAGGFVLGALLFLAGLILLGAVVSQSSGERWVQYVLVVPILGRLLEQLFLPPTYFRMDTGAMFEASIREAVREAVDGLTKAKGVRALTDEEWKPTMQELFRR